MSDTARSRRLTAWAATFALAGVAVVFGQSPVQAARISNAVASFSGLDKITGRITSFDVYVGETVQFGALQVTPRACFSRDETEAQRVDSFVQVDEITLDRKIRRIFNGWMFADSPALNAVEHPIFDVWLKECKKTSDLPAPAGLTLPPSQPDTTGEPAKPAAPVTPPAAAAPVEPGLDAAPQDTPPAQDPNTTDQPLTDPNAPLPLDDPQAPQGDVFGQPGQQPDFGAPDQQDFGSPDQQDSGFGEGPDSGGQGNGNGNGQ